jgi:ubiquitin carboxyl-terminal hydrolase 8
MCSGSLLTSRYRTSNLPSPPQFVLPESVSPESESPQKRPKSLGDRLSMLQSKGIEGVMLKGRPRPSPVNTTAQSAIPDAEGRSPSEEDAGRSPMFQESRPRSPAARPSDIPVPPESDPTAITHTKLRHPLPQVPRANGQRSPRPAPSALPEEMRSGSAPPTLPHSPLSPRQPPSYQDLQSSVSTSRPSLAPESGHSARSIGGVSVSDFSNAFPSLDQFENGYFPSVPRDDPAAVSPMGPPPPPPTFPIEDFQSSQQKYSSVSLSDLATRGEISKVPRAGPSGLRRSPKISPFRQVHASDPAVSQSAMSSPPSSPRTPIKNYIEPLELYARQKAQANVLLIDVRPREAYDRGRIFGESVCIEPILLRNEVESTALENKLVLSPERERTAFCDRDKFDFVVIYDADSRSLPNYVHDKADEPRRALYNLHLAIYTQAFQRTLKRPPMLLVGGWYEWQRQIGAKGIIGMLDLPAGAGDRPGSSRSMNGPNRVAAANLPSADSTELSYYSTQQGADGQPDPKKNRRKAIVEGASYSGAPIVRSLTDAVSFYYWFSSFFVRRAYTCWVENRSLRVSIHNL